MVILGSFTHTYSQSYGKNKYRDKNYLDGSIGICQLMYIAITVIAKQKEEAMTRKSATALSAIAAAALSAALPANAADTISQNQSVKRRARPWRFADGSGWKGVYDNLTKRGYRVTIVQNPLTSLADDVAATKRALERQDGPVILVGHSRGGTVITEAGVDEKVAGLVYVSALSPDAGETTAQQYQGFAPASEFVIETTKDGFGYVSPAKFKAGFAHDVSDADVAFMRDAQVPINMSAFGTARTCCTAYQAQLGCDRY